MFAILETRKTLLTQRLSSHPVGDMQAREIADKLTLPGKKTGRRPLTPQEYQVALALLTRKNPKITEDANPDERTLLETTVVTSILHHLNIRYLE